MAQFARMFELRFEAFPIDEDDADDIHVRLSESQALELYHVLHEVFGGTCRCEAPKDYSDVKASLSDLAEAERRLADASEWV